MEPWYSLYWFDPDLWAQFRFTNPLALYLIPTVGLLLAIRYYLHRGAQQRLNLSLGSVGGRSQAERFNENAVRANQILISSLRFLLPSSILIAMSLLLVALARPQLVETHRVEQSEGIDIMLAMDVSSSMTETDLPPNRLAAAKRVAQTFINGRKSDRIGLVIFAGEAFSLCPLTTDHDLLKQYLSELDDKMIDASGTAIGDALARCINRMRESGVLSQDSTQSVKKRSKIVILISDGDNTAGNLDPITAARLAKAFNIRLYTIAVGRVTRSSTSASTIDEGILKTIAGIGSGSFFRAIDAGRLRSVFAQIDRLEKAPVRMLVYEDVQDCYRAYLYWAISFLLFALCLKTTVVGNILED
jgi:Ca-activated chloride channel family protein